MDNFPADFRARPRSSTAPAPTTYPIASYTYLLVYEDQTDATKGKALVAFIYWALTDGQAAEAPLGLRATPAPRSPEGARRSSTGDDRRRADLALT